MDGPQKGTGYLKTIGMICKSIWMVRKKVQDDLETIGMICKSYGWSVKRYRLHGDDRNDL